jgi:hypothetical protein
MARVCTTCCCNSGKVRVLVSVAVTSVVPSVVGLLQPMARAKIPKPIKMLFLMVRIVNSMLSIKTKNSAAE